ncbi:uncharacterized protein LOC127143990 [Cucumis melo]|uniref:Uncharacterized protein LOC127143990 n=1 Tax=Cucumis melo TaxID=3656 RepID=A0ABM3KBW7_CUCME|nr:uncharacterized protein LOC127143990 [Cucumis melo]
MKTFSSLSIVVVSVRPSLYSSSLSSHDFPRIFYFSASISQTCNLLASSNLSPSSTWVLLRVLCLPARLSTAIRHLKLMIRARSWWCTILLDGSVMMLLEYRYFIVKRWNFEKFGVICITRGSCNLKKQ